jgi:hypothetical protein
MSWKFAGAIIWLVACYLQNDRLGFYAAMGVALGLIFFCKAIFRLPQAVLLGLNTLVLLLVLLPMFDLLIRPRYVVDPVRDDARKLYSYESARRDPEAFAAWWQLYYNESHKLAAQLARSGPAQHQSVLPPGSHGWFFQCPIRINNKGFRGPDIPDEKGDAYRIVALGESTTFGATMHAGDKPWPELLEEMIRERLKPHRPVQVVNAGMYGFTIANNVKRLPGEILPLKPDLIISYHGINGFGLLDPAIPPLTGPRAPAFRPRPLVLLARAEYGIKMMVYRQRLTRATRPPAAERASPLQTSYALAYRNLIEACATNHIRLALGNFSMAVNDRSDPDVVAFYQTGFPSVYRQIPANKLHSSLIQGLVKEFPELSAIDTQLALENIFAGIRDAVASDLAR